MSITLMGSYPPWFVLISKDRSRRTVRYIPYITNLRVGRDLAGPRPIRLEFVQ